jgi:hypothetical protein
MTTQLIPTTPVDIVVTSPDGETIVLVEVKRRSADQAMRDQLATYAESSGASFVMTIDPQQIVVSPAVAGRPDWDRAVSLSTKTILNSYSEDADLQRIEAFYFVSLVKAWLRDFSFSWKSKRPPGSDELEQIGLTARLQEAETHTVSF